MLLVQIRCKICLLECGKLLIQSWGHRTSHSSSLSWALLFSPTTPFSWDSSGARQLSFLPEVLESAHPFSPYMNVRKWKWCDPWKSQKATSLPLVGWRHWTNNTCKADLKKTSSQTEAESQARCPGSRHSTGWRGPFSPGIGTEFISGWQKWFVVVEKPGKGTPENSVWYAARLLPLSSFGMY